MSPPKFFLTRQAKSLASEKVVFFGAFVRLREILGFVYFLGGAFCTSISGAWRIEWLTFCDVCPLVLKKNDPATVFFFSFIGIFAPNKKPLWKSLGPILRSKIMLRSSDSFLRESICRRSNSSSISLNHSGEICPRSLSGFSSYC